MSFFDKVVAAVTPPESAEDRATARRNAEAAAGPGDWLDMILGHHRQIAQAFGAAETAQGEAARTEAIKTLAALLTGHAMAEEAAIYPQLSHDHKTQMSMAYEEQQGAKVELALLADLDPLSQDWADKLGHIKGAVQHHVYLEESSRFMNLRQELPEGKQAVMTQRYREEIKRYGSGLQT
ncbi:MAG: hemerythrin domain-containing protein [Pseudomonadota bacterium]